jgi:hypothetical protein
MDHGVGVGVSFITRRMRAQGVVRSEFNQSGPSSDRTDDSSRSQWSAGGVQVRLSAGSPLDD